VGICEVKRMHDIVLHFATVIQVNVLTPKHDVILHSHRVKLCPSGCMGSAFVLLEVLM